MAIALSTKTNVEAPSGDYPFGNIKDNSGNGDGTPINKQVYADFHQFFAKLFAESGLTYNGQPDNNANGFQYVQALYEAIYLTSKQWPSPKFHAGDISSIPLTISTAIQYLKPNNVTINTNNYYDGITGRYTPLVEGYYLINVHYDIRYSTIITPGFVAASAAILKNSSIVVSTMQTEFVDLNDEGKIKTAACSGVVYLNGSTDYVNIGFLQNEAESPIINNFFANITFVSAQ